MGDTKFSFEDLEAWQKAVDFEVSVIDLLEKLPQNKHIRLISQKEAAVTSPSQNTCHVKLHEFY